MRIFVNKNSKKVLTVPCFCLTKQKESAVLILLDLQNNSIGSVLTNNGSLGGGIKELKPGIAAPFCDKNWIKSHLKNHGFQRRIVSICQPQIQYVQASSSSYGGEKPMGSDAGVLKPSDQPPLEVPDVWGTLR